MPWTVVSIDTGIRNEAEDIGGEAKENDKRG